MLINVSNHLSIDWSKEKKEIANRLWGEIVDMPFPEIDPNWGGSKVCDAAYNFSDIIRQKINESSDKINAVYIMEGEMSFTYSLIHVLMDSYILCVASTSKQIKQEDKNGNKTIISQFVKFRKYPYFA